MNRILAVAVALLLATSADARRRAVPAPVPASAGGLVDNANGYTLDRDGRVARFTGLLIDKDGKVVRLLGAGEARPERLDFRLDARGRTLLPGMIDAHGHVMDLGFRKLQLDLSAATSLADAQRRVAAYAAARPAAPWIEGGGWNQEAWGLGRFPTAADLDAVVRDRPVALERIDNPALRANSAAMAAAGVTVAT